MVRSLRRKTSRRRKAELFVSPAAIKPDQRLSEPPSARSRGAAFRQRHARLHLRSKAPERRAGQQAAAGVNRQKQEASSSEATGAAWRLSSAALGASPARAVNGAVDQAPHRRGLRCGAPQRLAAPAVLHRRQADQRSAPRELAHRAGMSVAPGTEALAGRFFSSQAVGVLKRNARTCLQHQRTGKGTRAVRLLRVAARRESRHRRCDGAPAAPTGWCCQQLGRHRTSVPRKADAAFSSITASWGGHEEPVPAAGTGGLNPGRTCRALAPRRTPVATRAALTRTQHIGVPRHQHRRSREGHRRRPGSARQVHPPRRPRQLAG